MTIRDRIKQLEDERSWIFGRSGGVLAAYERERLGEISAEQEQLWEQWRQEAEAEAALLEQK